MKAASVAGADPRAWREFLTVLGRHAQERSGECVQAPPETMQVAQGRAREALDLVRVLTDAVTAAGRIMERRS